MRIGPGFRAPQSVLLNALYREGESVYAVLDAVRDARIPAFLDASGERYARVDEENPASPFLVLLPPQSRLLDVLVKDGWNHGWGFYLTAAVDFDNALRHWRPFVTLHNRNGQSVTFRFWEPRVLRAIVPAMPFGRSHRFLRTDLAPGGGRRQAGVGRGITLCPTGVSQRALAMV